MTVALHESLRNELKVDSHIVFLSLHISVFFDDVKSISDCH